MSGGRTRFLYAYINFWAVLTIYKKVKFALCDGHCELFRWSL